MNRKRRKKYARLMRQQKKALSPKMKRWQIFMAMLLFGSLAFITSYSKVFEVMDSRLSDQLYSYISSLRNDNIVKIVSIDEKTVKKYGEFHTWSRERIANFIKKLNTAPKNYEDPEDYEGPGIIGFDLDFSSTSDEKGDTKLSQVCSKYDNICMGINTTLENPKTENIMEHISEKNLKLPYPSLCKNVTLGLLNNTINSSDGYVRNAIANSNVDGTRMDSFSFAIYKKFMNYTGMAYQPPRLDDNNSFAFSFSKKSGEYEVYSFYDIMEGNVNPAIFAYSIVLVGDFTDTKNTLKVPNQRDTEMQSIEVQANIIEALMNQSTGQPLPNSVQAFFNALFIALFFLITSYGSKLRTIIETIILIFAEVFLCLTLTTFGFYFKILIPITFLILVALFNLIVRYFIIKRKSMEMVDIFAKYVDENVVSEIISSNSMTAHIGGVQKDIAVLFIDIRGFTSLSEQLAPETIVSILNIYLTMISRAVSENEGTLDKFIGDAAMAVFNSPMDLPDYEFKAVCTAWDILSHASTLNETCKNKYGVSVTFGIGIHCGPAVIGNIGSEERMDFTAIGDVVNTTSRLEGIAAPGQILISEEMHKRLGNRIISEFAGKYTLKGKRNEIPAYNIIGINKVPKKKTKKQQLLDDFNKLLDSIPNLTPFGGQDIE